MPVLVQIKCTQVEALLILSSGASLACIYFYGANCQIVSELQFSGSRLQGHFADFINHLVFVELLYSQQFFQ